jgi:competence protein ComEC
MLDVGQGDCFVISSAKQTFIIDGGGKLTQAIGNNTGKNVLIPFLNYKAKNFVDAVFVTHSDADHIIGIIELVDNKQIGKIFLAEQIKNKIYDDKLAKELVTRANKNNIPIEFLKSGDCLYNKDIIFNCVYPFDDENTKDDNNNNSLVMQTKIKGTKILFTGDIESSAEQEILKSNLDINSNILKLAHHGSKTSSQKEFLEEVNPELAIVSTGKNNPYGHPSKETVKTLDELNIPLLNTANAGAITIRICDDNKIELYKML